MKEKILVYDTSIGYGKYFEKIFNREYEIQTSVDQQILKKIDLLYYDSIIFIANEKDDINLFSTIYATKKGVKLFLGITQEQIKKQFNYIQDIHYINLEFNKKDIIEFISKKLELQLA